MSVGVSQPNSSTSRRLRAPKSLWLVLLFCAVVIVPALGLAPVQPAEGQQPDPAKGQELYETFCMACHNEHKLVGPPMVEDVGYFVRAGIPTDMLGMLLQKPVRVKREGSIMPAFAPDQLSDADLADIGAYLGSHYTPPAAPPALGSAANGAGPYATYCAMCHGANGEGVGKMTPLAFMAAEFKQYNLPPHLMLAFVNLACRSGSIKDMPVIGEDKLSDQDLADIAAYIWEMPVPEMPAPPAGH